MFEFRAGVRENWEKEFAKTVIGGCSAVGGFAISEFAGEFITRALGYKEAVKFFVKSMIRITLGLVFAVASWHLTGLPAWILLAMSMGCFGGIVMDIIEVVCPGGIKGLAEMAVASTAKPVAVERVSFVPAPSPSPSVEAPPISEDEKKEVVEVTEESEKTEKAEAGLYS